MFIWYPDGGNVGHAALNMGNYEVGKKFVLSLDRMNTGHFKAHTLVELNHGHDFGNVHHNDNYVTWWPGGSAGPFDCSIQTSAFIPRLRKPHRTWCMNSTAWTSNICEPAGIACATNRTLTIN